MIILMSGGLTIAVGAVVLLLIKKIRFCSLLFSKSKLKKYGNFMLVFY